MDGSSLRSLSIDGVPGIKDFLWANVRNQGISSDSFGCFHVANNAAANGWTRKEPRVYGMDWRDPKGGGKSIIYLYIVVFILFYITIQWCARVYHVVSPLGHVRCNRQRCHRIDRTKDTPLSRHDILRLISYVPRPRSLANNQKISSFSKGHYDYPWTPHPHYHHYCITTSISIQFSLSTWHP